MKQNDGLFDIPGIAYFESKNPFTGSLNGFRFRLAPDGEEIHIAVWTEDLCFEKCTVEKEQIVPLTAQGLEEGIKWLEQQYQNR